METPQVQIGLSDDARQAVIDQLKVMLANNYVLYTKTQVFHWNVQGKRFHMLHKMFEEQYETLSEANDDIAERIRSLGNYTPLSLKSLVDLATLQEADAVVSDDQMVAALLNDHQAMCEHARKVISVAEEQGDDGTADFVTARLEEHEKTAWMLRSSL